jgi:hypothetical protein
MRAVLLYTLYTIAVLWLVAGTLLILYTEGTRAFLKRVFLGDSVRWMAVFPLLLGLLLVVGAFFYQELFWLALVLGILALLKGVYAAVGPSSQVKGILEWWFNQADDITIRLWGLISFTLGIALLSYLV